ncbi:MAG: hypothetical protein JO266_20930 [Acidobacteria bacterium]|nr:hypothetical protein [Acidobacteriota bacterium]MBV9483799.1 hypothetical protein [Acidobacteriota bacterium]
MPKRNPEKAIQMLDAMLEFFGENGQRWTYGEWRNILGQRCMAGALRHLRSVMHIKGDTAGEYLREAIRLRHHVPYAEIPWFNDACRSYDDIRDMILGARALAEAEFDRQRDQKRGHARSGRDSAPVQIEGKEAR